MLEKLCHHFTEMSCGAPAAGATAKEAGNSAGFIAVGGVVEQPEDANAIINKVIERCPFFIDPIRLKGYLLVPQSVDRLSARDAKGMAYYRHPGDKECDEPGRQEVKRV